jgi:sucrose-6-phosphate hydrolase SacC (GH32 family)
MYSRTKAFTLIEPNIILYIFLCLGFFYSCLSAEDAGSATTKISALEKNIKIEKQYLNMPVKNGAPKRYVDILADGKIVREFQIELPAASEKPDFWVFLDVAEFKNKTLTVRLVDADNADSDILSSLTIDDQIKGGEIMYREKLRPQFHFTSRRGWCNDTNGMVYYDGEYHLFYQHNPYALDMGRNQAWGHAVSPDMIHWQELGDAIHPDALGLIWSGSAVIDHDNTAGFQTGSEKTIVCFYTSAGGTNPVSQGKPFTQSIAYSNDRGRTWTKYEHNPVIDHISGGNRDPKVFWNEATKQWVMVLFLDNGIMGFFTSSDLKSWTKQSELKGLHECPELFELSVDGDPLNKKWILHGGSGDYLIGQFDGKQFQPEVGPVQFHYGNCFYASQTFNNIPQSDGRRVQMAWGQVAMPNMPFNQMILFPVSLTLRTTPEGIRMYAEPVKEIETLHGKSYVFNETTLGKDFKQLEEINSELMHIRSEFLINDGTCGFSINGVDLVYNSKTQELNCLNLNAKLNPVNGKIRLEILVDRTSIEIFANDGIVYMPISKILVNSKKSIDIICTGDTKIYKTEIFELNSAWGELRVSGTFFREI